VINLTKQEQAELALAGQRLAKNPDLKKFLTLIKKECIQDLIVPNASPDALVEANRRHDIADALEHRINQYGRS
jgi:hypothetical protein